MMSRHWFAIFITIWLVALAAAGYLPVWGF